MERNRRIRRRKIIIIILLLSLMITITFTSYAFWEDRVEFNDNIIPIGEERNVVVDVVAKTPTEQRLIPLGAVPGHDELDSITLLYYVFLDFIPVVDLTLTVSVTNVTIDNQSVSDELVNITVYAPEYINHNISEVFINITISEPQNENVYFDIINKDISFTLVFSAVQ